MKMREHRRKLIDSGQSGGGGGGGAVAMMLRRKTATTRAKVSSRTAAAAATTMTETKKKSKKKEARKMLTALVLLVALAAAPGHWARAGAADSRASHLGQQQRAADNSPASDAGHKCRRSLHDEDAEERLEGLARRRRRRQALELVVNRLRILESLDEQLRAFSEAAELAQKQQQQQQQQQQQLHAVERHDEQAAAAAAHWPARRQIYCRLELPLELAPGGQQVARAPAPASCLANRRLLNQIPPYMLNLYRQLLFELQPPPARAGAERNSTQHAGAAAAAVQLMMPYGAQVMRSFRQPKMAPEQRASAAGGGSGRPAQYPSVEVELEPEATQQRRQRLAAEISAAASDFETANVVVELNVLPAAAAAAGERDDSSAPADSSGWPKWRRRRRWLAGAEAPLERRPAPPPEPAACSPRQRLLDAAQRDEICFWFELSENFARSPSNRSLVEFRQLGQLARRPSDNGAELLVEAELHVFKLFPHQRDEQVSLYQILPQRPAPARLKAAAGAARDDRKQPTAAAQRLRLLDIRRIDLNSNGWETFYVKRAVDDWLSDARLNLGLVIKAKSMFDEPIRPGLIRFADAYDHRQRALARPLSPAPPPPTPPVGGRQRRGATSGAGASGEADYNERPADGDGKQLKAVRDFDLSHQPLLVIYTTAVGA